MFPTKRSRKEKILHVKKIYSLLKKKMGKRTTKYKLYATTIIRVAKLNKYLTISTVLSYRIERLSVFSGKFYVTNS